MTEPQEPRGTAPVHPTSEELSECVFSPETAAAGPLEHAAGCARCAQELADLRLLLTELAALPEPELPESVAIRMDAAVARAWQDADAEREAAADAAAVRSRRRLSWPKIAIPLASLSLIVLAVVGVGALLHHSSSSSSAGSSSAGSAMAAPNRDGSLTDAAAVAWVHSILTSTYGTSEGPRNSPEVEGHACAQGTVPKRSGDTVLTTSHREFEGEAATLVVYQNAQEPASPTVFAVVYAGSCPSSASRVLVEGLVSR